VGHPNSPRGHSYTFCTGQMKNSKLLHRGRLSSPAAWGSTREAGKPQNQQKEGISSSRLEESRCCCGLAKEAGENPQKQSDWGNTENNSRQNSLKLKNKKRLNNSTTTTEEISIYLAFSCGSLSRKKECHQGLVGVRRTSNYVFVKGCSKFRGERSAMSLATT